MKVRGVNNRRHGVRIDPHLRVWFDRERTWHGETIRVHGETRFVADDADVEIAIFLSDGRSTIGAELASFSGKVTDGRLVGEDGERGVEHELTWQLEGSSSQAEGIQAKVTIPTYGAQALTPLLVVDLVGFRISE